MRLTTRALLLTDVVDSTRLSETLGDARMAQVWAAHDRIARDLLAAHRGREIDKTDGFLLLFDEASDAATYAIAYHRALAGLDPPLRARAGLHVGGVILTENSAADVARGAKPLEVDGLAKPTAARVMSLALGGQTLLTQEAADALGLRRAQAEPDGAGPASGEPVILLHGHWMLKGLVAPVPIFELGVPGEAPMKPPSDTPKAWRVTWRNEAWVPVRAVKHGLPAERDAFVGRAADLQDLARRLDDGARLVSVLGIGGTGKTRLVTHYGWTWLGSWPGGAWFCDLSEARSADGICGAVARALDVPLGKDDPVVQLGHAIAGRGKCLVILDNFEQVTRHAPETLGKWLDRAGEAQFLVTTREVLGLPGETSLALAPLREDEAVELFVARAVQAKRDFVLTDEDRPYVHALVKLLDYLPLAIELAAARVRVMPPRTLLQRMSERFKLLTSSGGRHTRQATLRATLDWSWEMLSSDEQQALAQLSVFEGGFTLEAAEAVLLLPEAWPADAVQSLVDKSLVRPAGGGRFDLLVSVQEYASLRLVEHGAEEATQARHGRHFAQHGTVEAIDSLTRHGGVGRLRSLVADRDNLVAACRRALAREDVSVAVPALLAAWKAHEFRGPFDAACELGEEVVALVPESTVVRLPALRALARALMRAGRLEKSLSRLHEALALSRASGDRHGEVATLCQIGETCVEAGRGEEARAFLAQALDAARELADRGGEAAALGALGRLHWQRGEAEEGRACFEAELVLLREIGDRVGEGVCRDQLGLTAGNQGRHDEARAHHEAALAIAREVGNRSNEGAALGNIGVLLADSARHDEARPFYEAAVVVFREIGFRRGLAIFLGNLASLDLAAGRHDEARGRFEEALAIHREIGFKYGQGFWLDGLSILALEAGDAAAAVALSEQAVDVAEGFPVMRAEFATSLLKARVAAGDLEGARAALGIAEAVDVPVQHRLEILSARITLLIALRDASAARAALAEADALVDERRTAVAPAWRKERAELEAGIAAVEGDAGRGRD